MPLDPRTPVIVGVGQTLRRPDDPATAGEPVAMMVEALEQAAADAGAARPLLQAADSVRVPAVLSWRYSDPGRLVADRVGASPRQTVVTTTGGNSPQMLVNDTAAAIQRGDVGIALVAGAEAARASGVPQDRWVFPWSGADAHDHWFVSERADLHSSPAIRLAGQAALELAGAGIDDIAHVDLYSCFPSAVQIGAAELGLGLDEPDRPLTVTGGLSFAGGPGNNYAMHSIAAMVDVLRADPGAKGLVTALGWYITKHSVGVYSTEPPPKGFGHARPQDEVDALPRRAPVGVHEGA